MAGKADPKAKVLKETTDDQVTKKTRSYRKSPSRVEVPPSPTTRGRAKSPARNVGVKVDSSPSRTKNLTKTPEKKRPRGRPKSPARKSPVSKSPQGRSPIIRTQGRPKSPSRKSPARTKSPSRKSPSRQRSVGRKSESPSLLNFDFSLKKPSEKPILEVLNSDSDDEVDSKPKVVKQMTPVRRSSRIREVERIVHLRPPIAKISEFSDEDDMEVQLAFEPQQQKPEETKSKYWRFVGAMLEMVMTAVLFISMLVMCNELQCSFSIPDLSRFKQLDTFFDLPVFLSFTAYVLLIAILSALPFGGKKCEGLLTIHGKFQYVMNGLFSAVTILSVAIGLELKGIRVSGYIQEHFLKLGVSGFVLALPLAFFLYFKTLFSPVCSLKYTALQNTGLYNFFYGSEVNPRIYGVVDVKMLLHRVSFISILLLASSFIYESLECDDLVDWSLKGVLDVWYTLKFNSSVMTVCIMIIVNSLDSLIFEHTLLSSKEVQYESVGYRKCLESFCFIFLYSMIPKFVLDYGIQSTWYKCLACGIFFLAGYIIYRGSNSQKHAFRQNPYSPSISHLNSIPTNMGKSLICSSYWGVVRHPNYTGDIMMNLSLLPFVCCYPPCIVIYTVVLFLVQRAYDDNKRCKDRYGPAWDRYCQKVKYVLIPKVY
ncbi:PREDICTED: delta(14)-sterol reductase [Nicrophorus vespilloides]|uniref:Delta(14)-sterol reductase n=1 Tax=Nicrophorus vespilloides TaxID=110193 RepID=A0ABM1MCM9_NICVS|nr:PREDICTED: delta(14)-sterol reductase [Nicrophorus vespilloides]XP_017772329.1 PREDICTED: delta(14)-sterol reductase [Nicrophorus vespilloides]